MQNRPLRPFEQGAHLHVLDWAHQTARYRFQAAGAVQVQAGAKAVVKGPASLVQGSLTLPALEAAIHSELRKLYALGHATVRSELDHQADGHALPVGLSTAPAPPNLRPATKPRKRCGTCEMFESGLCWGYGNYGVQPDEVCDSWTAETVTRTLAVADAAGDPGPLAARARLAAQAVAHAISQAIHRGRLLGVSGKRSLREVGVQAGSGALSVAASNHAGGAIAAGRRAAANGRRSQIEGARYTSVLDKNTCSPCADADTGILLALDSPEWVPTPNPACLGGDKCRCIHVYQLATESVSQAIAAGG